MIDLPDPKSSYLDGLRANQEPDNDAPVQPQEARATTPPTSNPLQEPESTRSRLSRRDSIGALDADPWASPELHRGHDHSRGETGQSILNGFGNDPSARNSWSDSRGFEEAYQQTFASNAGRPNGQPEVAPPPPSSSGSGWGGSMPGADGGLGGGLGSLGNTPREPNPRRRSLGVAGKVSTPQVEETVTVTLLPEKEGLFMFQHRNYEVKSARRGSTVVRRYSDFAWLLDCLHKRYPFRQLPLLPPKRISGTSRLNRLLKALLNA